jgi:hypothetical protein
MSQRAVLQCLSLTEWKIAQRLPIPVGELMLSRLALTGWIEVRGDKNNTEVGLIKAGLKKMQSPIPK